MNGWTAPNGHGIARWGQSENETHRPGGLAGRDAAVVWHPYSHLRDFFGALPVRSASGAHLFLEDGRKLIDGISSWWVNVHGHCHPHIISAVQAGMSRWDQVIFADLTHEAAVSLAERVLRIYPAPLSKVFFSDNGSTAVEVALKLAIQSRQLSAGGGGGTRLPLILALEGSYHGDTFGAMAASARGVFTASFKDYLFEVVHLPVHSSPGSALAIAERCLRQGVAALIYEPLLQGAGGMLMAERELLGSLLLAAKDANACLIADEVLTGFGRTGTLFAHEQLGVAPDLVCLSKGLTGGVLPLGLTLVSGPIVEAFRRAEPHQAFFHGHSFTANPWSCLAAGASLDLFEQEAAWRGLRGLEASFQALAGELRSLPGAGAAPTGMPALRNIRTLGGVLAFDLEAVEGGPAGYLNALKHKVAGLYRERGIYLRPLGNTVYLMPPYCVDGDDMSRMREATLEIFGEGALWNN